MAVVNMVEEQEMKTEISFVITFKAHFLLACASGIIHAICGSSLQKEIFVSSWCVCINSCIAGTHH